MAKTKISEFSSTPANNTDIDSINIAEGCAPSGINDAIRELMAQLKDFQTGAQGDSFNGPIGTSTAAAGAFTTLSATGAVTISGGTANGVAYLNGSKVVTSGSALTFDGTNYLSVTGLRIGGSDTTNTIYQATGALALSTGSTSPVVFNVNLSEVGRFTSTGLGIGTSSPQAKLQVLNTIKVSSADQSSGNVILGDGGSTSFNVGIARWNGSTNAAGTGGMGYFAQGPTNSGGHFWYTGDASAGSTTKQMTLDTSGNLGLGVTPSAWDSTRKVFQVGGSGALWASSSGAGTLFSSNNAYFDGTNFRYLNTSGATYFAQLTDGSFSWNRASSGTAGTAITFTQAMTLTAAGNLGVGVTSPTNKIDLGFTDTTIGWYLSASYSAGISYNSGARSMTLSTKSADSADFIAFSTGTAATERARIDSSGNLLVGTTSGTENRIFKSSSTYAARIENTSTSAGSTLLLQSGRSAGTGFTNIECYANGSLNFQVLGNGNVQNTNNSYGAISDIKLKENISDATPKLSDLMQVKVRNYNLIGDTTKQLGVVAQELETIFPAMVDEVSDKDIDGNDLGTTTKQVKYSVFVPMLIKALQEQQAIIDSLKARLDAANL